MHRCSSLTWFLATGFLAPHGQAKECSFYRAIGKNLVYTQSDIDSNPSNCTTITGSILIANNFTGDLNLNGIFTITDGISIYDVDPVHVMSAPFLTSVTALDVNTVGAAGISGFDSVPMMKHMSFPNLQSIGMLEVHAGPSGVDLEFPSLTSAENVYLTGNIDNLNFKRLSSVRNDLTIVPSKLLAYGEAALLEYSNLEGSTFNAMPIDLRSLQNTKSLYLVGNITSVDVPLLVSTDGDVGTSDLHSPGVTIATNANSLSFVVLQALQGVDGDLSFSLMGSRVPANISLPALLTASNILIEPHNHQHRTPTVDCTPARTIWNSKSLSRNGTFTCHGEQPATINTQRGLGPGIIIAIGIGCALIAIVGIFLAAAFQRRKRGFEPKAQPAYEQELEERSVQARVRGIFEDVLPGYAPRVPTRVGVRRERGDVMSWGGETAVETLPGYEVGGYGGERRKDERAWAKNSN
ncbi:uncharacterized protein PAC_14557 [Phialocephala subalpina]|uniref:Receptor L-domain domain-containing protein n=1 Tax=Phialocephala subalpina TaxID=576137 RepID=A0A1L7XHY4_9HELO|nr:uncharacterized protein PAC_14557 [Phialocephala subalpina]